MIAGKYVQHDAINRSLDTTYRTAITKAVVVTKLIVAWPFTSLYWQQTRVADHNTAKFAKGALI